ncbi:MAG TPA: RNA methyltransferase [Sandaracinaceae bacterium LLY-WYZ-13_1]|nr:RNA methyltransferase [Sandaracinaceae bacterium LLY-WYZ-13_1]
MKRDHPDVIEVGGLDPLPAPAATVVEVLAPLVTPRRIARMDAVIARRTRSLVPVLEDLADPHNGAAVMRSADAFGCHEVHVVEDRHPFLVSHRVTRGTHRWLDLVRHGSIEACLAHLKSQGYRVFVAAMDGDHTPEQLAAVERASVVFGNEHKGVSEAVRRAADGTYAIPMEGFVESLNVSVASAITLYVASRGRHGDLDEAAREEIRARYLLASVRDAERLVRERLAT